MDIEPLYAAEQIEVPDALPEILKKWTKAAIRENPADLVAWSAEWFAARAAERKEEKAEIAEDEAADAEEAGESKE